MNVVVVRCEYVVCSASLSCAGFLVGLSSALLVCRRGRGVRPSSVTCPCCCSRACCSLGCAPGWRCFLGCSVGFSCSSLARLLAARLPLAFPRGLFLSLCLCFYYTINKWENKTFFGFLFRSVPWLVGQTKVCKNARFARAHPPPRIYVEAIALVLVM